MRRGAKKSLQARYDGPYRVVQPGPKTFELDIGGHSQTVSIDHLKPAHLDPSKDVVVAKPPLRGRPPQR